MRQKIIYTLAIICNFILILFCLFLFSSLHGDDRIFMLLFTIPGILSLIAILQGPDMEERRLMRRLRKANLRKELKAMAEFDS